MAPRSAMPRPTAAAAAQVRAAARRGGAEAGGAEREPSDRRRRPASPTTRADDADEGGLGGASRSSCRRWRPRARSRACSAGVCGRAGGGDRRGEQAGQHGAGQAEEQEQHLGVGGVGARGVERGAEVVADHGGAGAAGLEVAARRR